MPRHLRRPHLELHLHLICLDSAAPPRYTHLQMQHRSRPCSSEVEHPPCKRVVVSSNLTVGSLGLQPRAC